MLYVYVCMYVCAYVYVFEQEAVSNAPKGKTCSFKRHFSFQEFENISGTFFGQTHVTFESCQSHYYFLIGKNNN